MTKRISEFDIWRPGYGGAVVSVYLPGTTTLASIFTDESLSTAADNPVTLSSMLAPDGTRYGKFAAPLYTGQSYYINIDGIEDTGIIRPSFSSLDGEDASESLVTPANSTYQISLENYMALRVDVSTFGVFTEGSGGVAATNTQTLDLAIAALSSGGEVMIPAGTYKINSVEVPEGVVLRGNGREATILQSVIGDVSFTLVGDRAGFSDITLDGSSLSTGSIGVKSVGNDEIVFTNVMIRRFETGAHFLGGKGHIYKDFSIENTETGIKLHGDTDSGDSGNGDAFEDVLWIGGLVSVATTIGVSLSYEDDVCHNINFHGVGFESCTGTALDINGAQSIEGIGVWFTGNTKNINVQDDSAVLTGAATSDNKVVNFHIQGGRLNGGECEYTGTCQDVIFSNTKLENVDLTLTTPISNFIVLQDCYEDADVAIAGESTKLLRETTSLNGATTGLTTTNSATKAWSIELQPGQMVILEGKVIGRGRNVAQRGIYHISCGAYRVGSTLAYDTQTANFTAGATLTGASSGATARIQADADGGATGTLTLIDIQGDFIDNEIITDNNGTPGSATVNGTLTPTGAVVDGSGVTSLRTAYETNANWAASFVANGNEIELRVTGDTSQTVEWTVHVVVVSN